MGWPSSRLSRSSWRAPGRAPFSQAIASPVWGSDPAFTGLIAVLVAAAGFSKAAQFPFHLWLPDAMAAATPVSAYLHAAAVVKAGIYLLFRFSIIFHSTLIWNVLLVGLGLFTSVLAAWFAMQQVDLGEEHGLFQDRSASSA